VIDEQAWLAMWNGPDLDAIRAMSADDLEVTAVTAAIEPRHYTGRDAAVEWLVELEKRLGGDWSAVAVTWMPERTGSAPLRAETARCAVLIASASVSRSQRNFTVHLLTKTIDVLVVAVVGPGDCAQPWSGPGQRGSRSARLVHRHPQAGKGRTTTA